MHTGFGIRGGSWPLSRRRYRQGMLKRIFNKWDGSVDWIDLAQDRVAWQAVVIAVMNLRVS